MKALMISLALLTLGGCPFQKKPTQSGSIGTQSPTVQTATQATQTVAQAAKNLDEGRAKEDQKTQETLSKIKANVTAAKTYNEGNPEGQPKEKVRNELTVAEGRLDGVKADPAELAAAAQRALLVEQGKTQEAKDEAQRAADEAKANAAELVKIRILNEQLQKDQQVALAAQKKAQDDLVNEAQKNQRTLNDTIQRMRDQFMQKQAETLTYAGMIGLLLFGLGLGFGGPMGLKFTWPFGVLGLISLGLAQLVSQPWFKYACGAAAMVAIGVALVWVWLHRRAGDLAQAAQEKADHFGSILSTLVPILDKSYDQAKDDAKKVMDDTIFGPLDSKMDKSEKATIHLIRAGNETVAPDTPTPIKGP